jgi:hypothetical protein
MPPGIKVIHYQVHHWEGNFGNNADAGVEDGERRNNEPAFLKGGIWRIRGRLILMKRILVSPSSGASPAELNDSRIGAELGRPLQPKGTLKAARQLEG